MHTNGHATLSAKKQGHTVILIPHMSLALVPAVPTCSHTGLLGDTFSGGEAASSIGRLVWASLPLSNSNPTNANTGRPHTPPSAADSAATGTAAAASSRAAAAAAAAAAAGSSSVAWWPCEAIDPFNPPLGFELQPEHKLALSPAERRKYLPGEGAGSRGRASSSSSPQQQQLQQPNTPSPKGSLAAPGAAAADDSPGISNAAGEGGETPAAAAAAAGESGEQPPDRRKLLLMWFHKNAFEWRFEDEVLPFMQHKQEFKGKRRIDGVARGGKEFGGPRFGGGPAVEGLKREVQE
jgi:hypothetical protein